MLKIILTDTTATFIHSVPKSTDITAKEYTDGTHIANTANIAHNVDLDRGIISAKNKVKVSFCQNEHMRFFLPNCEIQKFVKLKEVKM